MQTQKTNNHGGRRAGTGRPSFFRGRYAKAADPMFKVDPPTTVALTPEWRKKLAVKVAHLSKELADKTKNKKAHVSRTVVIEALIRKHLATLTLGDILKMDR